MLLAMGMFNLLIDLDGKKLARFYKSKMELLAKLSFGIYLIHPFVINVLNDILGFDFDKISMNIYFL
jgi:peptidoglycan/LPS O-acetylase OafA/YrhL